MYRATFELEAITPVFMRGADQGKAEFRPASVKGVMRWWFRALAHAVLLGNISEKKTISTIRTAESEIFGDTGHKSRIRIQVSFEEKGKVNVKELYAKYLTFGLSGEGLLGKATILLSSPEREYLELVSATTRMAFTFGNLGARSTRGIGSVQPKGNTITPTYLKEVYKYTIEVFEDYFDHNLDRNTRDIKMPQFPAAHPRFFRVKLGFSQYNNPYGRNSALSYLDREFHIFRHSGPRHERLLKNGKLISYRITPQYQAVKNAYNGNSSVKLPYSAFGLPHQYSFMSLGIRGIMIEGERHKRRASPIRFKVIRSEGNKFAPMLTYFIYQFLPSGESMKVRVKNNVKATGIPQPEYQIVDKFFNQFPGKEVVF